MELAMSKRRAKSGSDQPLLDYLERIQAESRKSRSDEGSLNIADRLRVSMRQAIKRCPMSVHQIAGEMSHLLGETITAEMIYSWTSESKSLHQIWGTRLPAFCKVTESREPVEIIADAAGLFCVPGPEALRAEIQRFSEAESKARKEKRKRQLFLEELEGRK